MDQNQNQYKNHDLNLELELDFEQEMMLRSLDRVTERMRMQIQKHHTHMQNRRLSRFGGSYDNLMKYKLSNMR